MAGTIRVERPLIVFFFVIAALLPSCCRGQSAASGAPFELSLPSAYPTGDPVNDRIWVRFYPAGGVSGKPVPAVVLLHPLGEEDGRMMHRFAHYLAARGIAGAVMTLPFHMRRLPRHDNALRHFASMNVDRAAQAFCQSVSDVRTVVDWLCAQPGVDARRIGIIGVSLGAIIAHRAMGEDARLTAGVAILGGGNLPDLYRRSLLYKVLYPWGTHRLDKAELEQIQCMDPLACADKNHPRRVLMIQAARDLLMPPADALALWKALGRPPIRWLDTNHYAPILAEPNIMKASAVYLWGVWNDPAYDGRDLPPIYAPTIKLGMLMGLDSALTPTLSWQALSFAARRDHMSLLHADLGWSGRGPFVSLALTLNAFMDVGLARRLNGRLIRPYLSLHLVF
jgi:dienelactone hydrolase